MITPGALLVAGPEIHDLSMRVPNSRTVLG